MSRHVFTSDLHLGHERVAVQHRGFESVDDHDEAVVTSLYDLTAADVLWILGDVVGSARDWPRALGLLGGLPCRKRLVLGNHDPAHPMNPRAFRHTAALGEVFEWWGTAAATKIQGEQVLLSHFPYTRDRGEPRYLQWRLPNRGEWLLHGHTHGEERVTVSAETEVVEHFVGGRAKPIRTSTFATGPTAREIHVGWDAWRRPVADYEIHGLIRKAFVEEADASDPRFAPFEETDLRPYLVERDRVLAETLRPE